MYFMMQIDFLSLLRQVAFTATECYGLTTSNRGVQVARWSNTTSQDYFDNSSAAPRAPEAYSWLLRPAYMISIETKLNTVHDSRISGMPFT